MKKGDLLVIACRIMTKTLSRVGPAHNHDLIVDIRSFLRDAEQATTPPLQVTGANPPRPQWDEDFVVREAKDHTARVAANVRELDSLALRLRILHRIATAECVCVAGRECWPCATRRELSAAL